MDSELIVELQAERKPITSFGKLFSQRKRKGLDWLKENCPEIPERTGRRYIELYNKAVSNRTLMSDLRNMTPWQAYQVLALRFQSVLTIVM
jgi:hypothetical protein